MTIRIMRAIEFIGGQPLQRVNIMVEMSTPGQYRLVKSTVPETIIIGSVDDLVGWDDPALLDCSGGRKYLVEKRDLPQ